MKNIAVIGLGYVGLPLSLQFARNGVMVVGLDLDGLKIETLRKGKSYLRHIASADIAALVEKGLRASRSIRRCVRARSTTWQIELAE